MRSDVWKAAFGSAMVALMIDSLKEGTNEYGVSADELYKHDASNIDVECIRETAMWLADHAEEQAAIVMKRDVMIEQRLQTEDPIAKRIRMTDEAFSRR